MATNSWPGGTRRALHQNEHERWNSQHYPGTRQLCCECEEPTGQCEEDGLYVGDSGPYCFPCYYATLAKEEKKDGD